MLYNKSIILSGMSKVFCNPGLRIGWLITKNKDIMKLFKKFKDYTTICSPKPSEILSMICLKNNNYIKILNNIKSIVNKNRYHLFNFIQKNNDLFEYTTSLNKSGMTTFIKLNGLAYNIGAYKFCENIVNNCGVMLVPGIMFEYSDKFIRIGLGRQYLYHALSKLHEYLIQWRKQHSKAKL